MNKLYQQQNLTLLTDLYQLTMAYGYWKQEKVNQEAVFHLFFRKNPFKGNFAIACGLTNAIDYLSNLKFETDDLTYLQTLTNNNGSPLFEPAFLDYLANLEFTCSVDALPEGSIVFPNEPIVRIQGPIIQAQLIETALLNIIGFQTLIATKAGTIVRAAAADTVLEFGLRRAQGIDGGLSASRAAYIGGCHATSNVLAGKYYNIPVKGTHGHSWIMSFETEQEAFDAYIDAMPDNSILLVDTYNTIAGIKKAIQIGLKLQKEGKQLQGIRLDSGNLLELSQQARQLLDKAGLHSTLIVVSDGLDVSTITTLKTQGAPIDIWGVGTNLVTAKEQPALGAVYKLAATKLAAEKTWRYTMKLSDSPKKISTPGILQVRRYQMSNQAPFGSMIWNTENKEPITTIQGFDGRNIIVEGRDYKDMLIPIFNQGELVYNSPSIHQIRGFSLTQQARFSKVNFELYPRGLEKTLNQQKIKQIKQLQAAYNEKI